MARNFFRIFTENNPVMWDSKTFCIPEAKGLRGKRLDFSFSERHKNTSVFMFLMQRGTTRDKGSLHSTYYNVYKMDKVHIAGQSIQLVLVLDIDRCQF